MSLYFASRWVVVLTLLSSSCLFGGVINVGVFSFDSLIPGLPGAPGVNGFTISNFTGDPMTGGSAIPPDFPVMTTVSLLHVMETLNGSGAPQVFDIGTVGPGSANPISLQFPDTDGFTSALFSADLSTPTFLLFDGTTIVATSSAVIATLLPSDRGVLAGGTDLVTLSVEGSPSSSVPEPRSGVLVGGLLMSGYLLNRFAARTAPGRRRRKG